MDPIHDTMCLGIETSPFYPEIDKAHYLTKQEHYFPNSRKYGKRGIYRPNGPGQTHQNIFHCIETINSIDLS